MSTVTHQQIADAVGVSRATVSLALRNNRNVSESVRARVQAEARARGYRTNPLVAAHMAHVRSSRKAKYRATLAYLFFHPKSAFPLNSDFPPWAYFKGAETHAEANGYKVQALWLPKDQLRPSRLESVLDARGITGVIFGPLWEANHFVPNINWDRVAAATVAYTLRIPGIHRACMDHIAAMDLTFTQLQARGYQRIGVAQSSLVDDRAGHQWRAGALAHINLLPAANRVDPLFSTTLSRDELNAWWRREKPDVIVSGDARVRAWMRDARLRVPADVGFSTLFWQACTPAAGIDHNFHAVGAAAAELVIGQLINNERGLSGQPKTVLLPPSWRDGPTIRSL